MLPVWPGWYAAALFRGALCCRHAPSALLQAHADLLQRAHLLLALQAFDEEHVALDQERSGAALYLHQQARRVSECGVLPQALAAGAAAGAATGCLSRC